MRPGTELRVGLSSASTRLHLRTHFEKHRGWKASVHEWTLDGTSYRQQVVSSDQETSVMGEEEVKPRPPEEELRSGVV